VIKAKNQRKDTVTPKYMNPFNLSNFIEKDSKVRKEEEMYYLRYLYLSNINKSKI
jgi:hypothetical protein